MNVITPTPTPPHPVNPMKDIERWFGFQPVGINIINHVLVAIK